MRRGIFIRLHKGCTRAVQRLYRGCTKAAKTAQQPSAQSARSSDMKLGKYTTANRANCKLFKKLVSFIIGAKED